MQKIEDYEKGFCFYERENGISVEMCYPRNTKTKYVDVSISDVRASDGIRIEYDFDRDGYVIKQPIFVDVQKENYIEQEIEWEETFFAKSWKLEYKNKELYDKN